MDAIETEAIQTSLLARNPWVPRRKLDVAQYHRMGEAGIFRDRERVELIEGELIQMAPIGSGHSGAVNGTNRALIRAVGDQAIVSVHGPVRLGDYSEPEPDFMLLRPRDDDYRSKTPVAEDVLLLIEVSQSSLRYDRSVKLALYARHGIAEVWIVDLAANAVEWFRLPEGESYAETGRARRGETLTPALLPDVPVPVTAILG